MLLPSLGLPKPFFGSCNFLHYVIIWTSCVGARRRLRIHSTPRIFQSCNFHPNHTTDQGAMDQTCRCSRSSKIMIFVQKNYNVNDFYASPLPIHLLPSFISPSMILTFVVPRAQFSSPILSSSILHLSLFGTWLPLKPMPRIEYLQWQSISYIIYTWMHTHKCLRY